MTSFLYLSFIFIYLFLFIYLYGIYWYFVIKVFITWRHNVIIYDDIQLWCGPLIARSWRSKIFNHTCTDESESWEHMNRIALMMVDLKFATESSRELTFLQISSLASLLCILYQSLLCNSKKYHLVNHLCMRKVDCQSIILRLCTFLSNGRTKT